MGTENIKVRSANVARIVMDGEEIGLAQNVRMSDDYGPDAASGIGDIHVQEYVPSMARHTFSIGKLALRKTSLYKKGLIPENGEQVLDGLVFDVEIFDRKSMDVIRKLLNCSYASGDVEIQKHAIVSYNATYYATDVAGKL